MNRAYTPKVASETRRVIPAQFEELRREAPAAMREVIAKHIADTREVYERSKDVLMVVLDRWENSFGVTGQSAIALNHKVIDIIQRNINSGFELAKDLAQAKDVTEAMELQAAHWRRQLDALTVQAEEVRALSRQVTADVAQSIKEQMQRSL